MRKALLFLLVCALIPSVSILAGCSRNEGTSSVSSGGSGTGATVSLSVTDDPPTGVSVLFFQVALTEATLTGTSGSPVSLLSNNVPIQIDVTQLQTLSAFLSAVNAAPGTYNSLKLTFANPQLVIYNASNLSLGSTCAVGTVCELTPMLDNSGTVNLTSPPFPVTVTANSPLGFLVDLRLNKIIQPDLSADLSVANGVTVSTLPRTLGPEAPEFGYLTGTVESVNISSSDFTLQTRWGKVFTVTTTGSTTWENFPGSACTTPGPGCLAQGQIVRVKIVGVASGGVLTAGDVSYLQAVSAQAIEGTVLGVYPSTMNLQPAATVMMMVHWNPASSGMLPMGGLLEVNVPSTATLSVDNTGFSIPAGLRFANDPQSGPAGAFVAGQEILVTVQPGSVGAAAPIGFPWWHNPVSVTALDVELEPSQMTGAIAKVDATHQSFTFGFGGPFFLPILGVNISAPLFDGQTTQQTSYAGFTPDSFDGLAANQWISVAGWMFAAKDASGNPIMAVRKVMLRPNWMN